MFPVFPNAICSSQWCSRSARVILSRLCWRGDMHMSHSFPTDPRSVMVDYSQQERFKSSELCVALCLHAAEGGTGSLAALPSSHPPHFKATSHSSVSSCTQWLLSRCFQVQKALLFVFPSASLPTHGSSPLLSRLVISQAGLWMKREAAYYGDDSSLK